MVHLVKKALDVVEALNAFPMFISFFFLLGATTNAVNAQ